MRFDALFAIMFLLAIYGGVRLFFDVLRLIEHKSQFQSMPSPQPRRPDGMRVIRTGPRDQNNRRRRSDT